MADVKLCKDCKWCAVKRPILFAPNYDYAKCRHSSTSGREAQYLVAGEPQVFCSSWRGEYDNRCGPEGKYWEPR
jgi:hypothetical protein